MGFEPRQMFSFMANHCDELLPIYLASVCMASPIVPLNESLSSQEIVNILRNTKPAIMFCNTDAYHCIKKLLTELEWNIKVFTFDGPIDDAEPVSNLLRKTGDQENFV